uniref:IS1 family transposase n=1 Tax=Escherichia coli TaxID=562 RepID=UPI001115038F
MASVSISCPLLLATYCVIRRGKSYAGHQRSISSHCRSSWPIEFTYTASQT